ncbi:LOW QUALITY PROTEIN: hypothetical protein MC885_005642 [Smutsia gigantea]|nr:LOW QUALITY PROTEIN: hypothetical protein MC885_005642 [Smutsia gigantea]
MRLPPAACGGRGLPGRDRRRAGHAGSGEVGGKRHADVLRGNRGVYFSCIFGGLMMSSVVRLHRGQYGRSSVTESNKPYKHFLPTYSPQEGYLKESEDVQSVKELLQNVPDYSEGSEDNHERYQYSELDDASSRDAWKEGLFQHYYQVIKKERDRERPSDCIIVSTDKAQREYAVAIGHRLQDHGLRVEMIHLNTASGLSRALQEVKDDGSPFCILVEQSDVNLSSCTVIILHESIKIRCRVPLDDALMLVAKEYRRFSSKWEQLERAGISLRAGNLVDDFLARECLTSYSVPLGIQHLLFLLNEGKHLYRNELDLLIDYLKTRKGRQEGFEMPDPLVASDRSSFQGRNIPMVGKPPPLLPTPGKRSFPGPPPPVPVNAPLLGLEEVSFHCQDWSTPKVSFPVHYWQPLPRGLLLRDVPLPSLLSVHYLGRNQFFCSRYCRSRQFNLCLYSSKESSAELGRQGGCHPDAVSPSSKDQGPSLSGLQH